MHPIDLIMISDDEEPDPRQTLYRDMALLDKEISKASTMVKELDSEVSSFVALLRAAQDRLHKAQERKEQLIDDKQKLLDRKLRFLESHPAMSVKREVEIKSDIIEVSPAIKTSPEASSSYITYAPAPAPAPATAILSLDHNTPGPDLKPNPKPDPENRGTAQNHVSPEVSEYIRSIKPSIRGHGRGSKRSYGGNLSGIRRGASISGRTPSEQQPQRARGKRRMIYSPYWEASDSDSEINPGRANIALEPRASSPQAIPANPKTHSRIEISSIIGGKTQGTWCNINKATSTVYDAGPYMALDRTLNHLLPKYPGIDGGVYVGDWLRKEVGKVYQIFVKKTVNHWLYYGKYQIASIREVSLDEWTVFSNADKNIWAEHMLEHQWGKMILQKKKLLTEEQCIKSNWEKVLGFFNQEDDRPKLHLKLLKLHFISYDRGLYDALCSAQALKSSSAEKRKWPSPEYEEEMVEGEDDDDFLG